MIRFEIGDVRLTLLDGGVFRLDGGAMFGVVPRNLWSKERTPDSANRIPLALNVLLVEDGPKRVLIDTGVGTKWDSKNQEIYALEPKSAEELLAPAALRPEDIDVVVNSHLHFDHAGGNTRRVPRGGVEAAFPRATFVVQRGELETATHTHERTRASYLRDDFEPLVREGRLRLVEGDVGLGRSLRLRRAPGHTPHMQVVTVTSGGGTLAFLADLVPTSTHVAVPWIMAYDLEPLATLATKKRILAEAHRGRWILVFEHDAGMPLGVLEEIDGRLRARPWGGGN